MDTNRQTAWLAAIQAKLCGASECQKSWDMVGYSLWPVPLQTSPWASQWGVEKEAPGQGSPLHTSEFRRLLASSISPLPLRAAGSDLAAFTAAAVPTSWNQPSWPRSSPKAITFLQVDIATSCPKQSCTVPLHF